jgi:hypothetical protein
LLNEEDDDLSPEKRDYMQQQMEQKYFLVEENDENDETAALSPGDYDTLFEIMDNNMTLRRLNEVDKSVIKKNLNQAVCAGKNPKWAEVTEEMILQRKTSFLAIYGD